jgi:hypothetical protein
MTRKIIPCNNDIESDESHESNFSKKLFGLKQFFDYDGDGAVELEDISKRCKSCVNAISYIYDVSLDNIPLGAIIGLIITIIATTFISSGVNNSSTIILKYNSNEHLHNFINYYSLSLASFIILHTCVLLHGCSIAALETSRELFQTNEVGCYCCCKNKKSKFGSCCRCFQQCAQVGVQAVWGAVGTLFMFIFYFFAIGFFVISILSTTVSYYLTKTCSFFSSAISQYKSTAEEYITQARLHINSADALALTIISKYNKWVNIQKDFMNSGMSQIINVDSPTYIESPEQKALWIPEQPKHNEFTSQENCNCFRNLIVYNNTDFNPMQEIAKGRSIISILNESIFQTQSQVQYYSGQLSVAETVCYDYSGLYDHLYLISWGAGLLLISQFIMFAVHYKYFSVWNYEAKLVRLNSFHITENK